MCHSSGSKSATPLQIINHNVTCNDILHVPNCPHAIKVWQIIYTNSTWLHCMISCLVIRQERPRQEFWLPTLQGSLPPPGNAQDQNQNNTISSTIWQEPHHIIHNLKTLKNSDETNPWRYVGWRITIADVGLSVQCLVERHAQGKHTVSMEPILWFGTTYIKQCNTTSSAMTGRLLVGNTK